MIDPSCDDAESFRREVDAAERAKPPPPENFSGERPPTVAELAARVTVIERELVLAREAFIVLAGYLGRG